MSNFDHDAAMQRGAARQEVIDYAFGQVHEVVEEKIGECDSTTALIRASQILINATGPTGYYASLPPESQHELSAQLGFILGDVRQAGISGQERRMIILELARKLLDEATAEISREFSKWESDYFRDGE